MKALALETPGEPRAIHPLFRYVAYFCLVDLLILPYSPLLTIPYSLPVVLLALVALGTVKASKFFFSSVAIAFLFMILSVMSGMILGKPTESSLEDLKRVFQFLTTVSYFFYDFLDIPKEK